MSINRFHTTELRSWRDPQPKTYKSLITNHPAAHFPIGLTMIDAKCSANLRIRAFADNVTAADSSFHRFKTDIHLDTWLDSCLYGASCTWLDVSKHSSEFRFGSLDTGRLSRNADFVRDIQFDDWCFDSAPKVLVWFSALDIEHKYNVRIFTNATNITPSGLKLHVGTWDASIVHDSTVHWVALPSNRPNMTAGKFRTPYDGEGPKSIHTQQITFDKDFKRAPHVLVALDKIDMGKEKNTRISACAKNITQKGMTLAINTWGDSILHGAGVSYLAIENFAPVLAGNNMVS